jgi:invasion protein IalB
MDIRHLNSSTRTALSWLLAAGSLAIFIGTSLMSGHAEQPASSDRIPAPDKFFETEAAIRGQRPDRPLAYEPWRKVCFKASKEPASKPVCRTTMSGRWDTGQTALRVDLVEREGDPVTRLQIFVPPGSFLQPGIKLTVDQGSPTQIPYVICLTNICVAASVANADVIHDLETGQTLTLETVNSNVVGMTNSLSLKDFAKARQGTPAQIFEQRLEGDWEH